MLHNGTDHWVCLLKLKNDVYVLDSGYSLSLSNSLKIQISCLLNQNSSFEIFTPRCQKQITGSGDCGVFAIANAVEFCNSKQIPIHTKYNDNPGVMRNHLASCFESGIINVFPKVNIKYNIKLPRLKSVSVQIFISCCKCCLADVFDNLVICQGSCEKWYHLSCAGLKNTPHVTTEFVCKACK